MHRVVVSFYLKGSQYVSITVEDVSITVEDSVPPSLVLIEKALAALGWVPGESYDVKWYQTVTSWKLVKTNFKE